MGALVVAVRNVWLVTRVMFGRGTPLWVRLALPGALLYGLWPLDMMPDFIPVAGWLDDAGVLLAAWWMVMERARRRRGGEGDGRSRVVEGEYRVVE